MLKVSNLYGFNARQAGGVGAPDEYWRVNVSEVNSGTTLQIYEAEFLDAVGGSDQTSGGTPFVDSTGGGSAANIYDNSTATDWSSAGALPHHFGYQFASAVSVPEITITTTGGSAPKTFDIEKSSDGSVYVDEWKVIGQTGWDTLELRRFIIPSTLWRVNITAINGGANAVISELEFRATAGGADQTATGYGATGYPMASSALSTAQDAADAFANNGTTTLWAATVSTGWLGWAFAADTAVAEVAITGGTSVGDSPKNFTIEKSVDQGDNWTVEGKMVQVTAWASGETRVFSNAVRIWRINVSAGNGSGYTVISQMEFRASAGGADQTVPGYTATGYPYEAGTALLGSGFEPKNAFDNNVDDVSWGSGSGGYPHQLGYAFTSTVSVAEVAITCRSFNTTDTPKDFTIEYSDDQGDNWNIAATVTNSTGWTASETRLFSVP